MKALYNRMTPYEFVTALPEEEKRQFSSNIVQSIKAKAGKNSSPSCTEVQCLSISLIGFQPGFEPAEFLQGGLCLLASAQVLTGCIKGAVCSLSLTNTQIQTDKHKHMKRFALKLIKTPLLARCCVCQSNSHLWICSRICPYTEPRFPAISHYC